jgi:CheY-like chemotaxis protein
MSTSELGRGGLMVLVAEDDEDDRLMLEEAWSENRMANELRFVHDGEELLDYLRQRGRWSAPGAAPRPGIILLDLNMPRKDGREALAELKADPALRTIPVVVLTTSKLEEDIVRSYELGVSSFITKPVSFEALVATVRDLGRYWFQIVRLPAESERA